MNKHEFVDIIAIRLRSRRDAAQALETILATIRETLAKGEKVTLAGFGDFEPVSHAPRQRRDPVPGESRQVPARTIPKFRASPTFRDQVTEAAQKRPTPPT
ncbi:MAG: HU family DNA-binding protein [Actinoallomurus sp.]